MQRGQSGQRTWGDDAVADNQDAPKSGALRHPSRGGPSHALRDFLIDVRGEEVLECDTVGLVVRGWLKSQRKRRDLQASRFAQYSTGTSNSDTNSDGIRKLSRISVFPATPG